MNSCWDQCMKYPPTATGQECVGAVYSSGKCTGYVGDTLVFAWSLTGDLSVITMAKECFDVNVNRCYNSYTYVDKSSKPRPAGDPCNPFRRSILLVVPTSTCRQTTTTSTQTQPSVLTTILATGEHSSEKLQTQATWPTTEISTQEVSETSATPTVSGSTSLESSLQTTTERAADISRSDETTAENTSNERTEELTTGIDLRIRKRPLSLTMEETVHRPEMSYRQEVVGG
ncbi:uncharacterized protein LOC112560408 [Pomacea canaliculata]|uniref:uncharacterized protein LOC112560408 n=1 Tax=Pomacea canaliculata TaxID=400727 RepID=UPI000D72554F|nr:uncharacterized protein LOC112560408 [Pomacea canaliculata]